MKLYRITLNIKNCILYIKTKNKKLNKMIRSNSVMAGKDHSKEKVNKRYSDIPKQLNDAEFDGENVKLNIKSRVKSKR